MSKTYSKMLVEFTWDVEKLNPGWWNVDNMNACLFGETHTRKDLLQVRVLEDHSLEEANDKLNRLSASHLIIAELGDAMGEVLDDMDDWLTDHYNPDGVPKDIKDEYNKRLKESFNTCGWCGGHVFTKTMYGLDRGRSVPGEVLTYVDHTKDCPFWEKT